MYWRACAGSSTQFIHPLLLLNNTFNLSRTYVHTHLRTYTHIMARSSSKLLARSISLKAACFLAVLFCGEWMMMKACVRQIIWWHVCRTYIRMYIYIYTIRRVASSSLARAMHACCCNDPATTECMQSCVNCPHIHLSVQQRTIIARQYIVTAPWLLVPPTYIY